VGGSSGSQTARKRSAGILLYREHDGQREVLLVHPGGPLWSRRDVGVWSIPKGEYEPEEDPLAAARREFAEELGVAPPDGTPRELGEVRQKSGKLVRAWALRGELDASAIVSNTFALEWPPHSGSMQEVPEVDRAGWFTLELAREKINRAQIPLLEQLENMLAGSPRHDASGSRPTPQRAQ
jgi:predicted NUDIX family NTP pyrophosphohydrolase